MDLSEFEIVLEFMLNYRRSGVIILITLNIAAVQKNFWLGSNKSENIISENTCYRRQKERILIQIVSDIKKRVTVSICCKT